jgi:hypothetical protein
MLEDEDFNPGDILENLALERKLENIDEVAQAKKILLNSVAGAAHTIATIALHSTNEAMRFKASTAILDRVLGKDGTSGEGSEDVFEKLHRELVEAENAT